MFVGYLVMDFLEREGTSEDVRRQIYRYQFWAGPGGIVPYKPYKS